MVLKSVTMGLGRRAAVICCAVFLTLFGGSASSYIDGVAKRPYEKGDDLMVKVNGLMSVRNQVPYSYYSLPYCRPENLMKTANNLEAVLFGDNSEMSPFVFKMLEAERCRVVCRIKLNAKMADDFEEMIQYNYRVRMILDGMPLVTALAPHALAPPTNHPGYFVGIMGRYVGEQMQSAFIHNHLSFTIKYNKDPNNNFTNIVGFEVKPSSITHKYNGEWNEKNPLTTCKEGKALHSNSPLEVLDGEEIVFTYDVDFQESAVKWESRWDTYMVRRNEKVHWFNALNSLAVALFLIGKVAIILSRTLRSDISIYNTELESNETQEENGWKAVHGDVFLPPSNANLFCICIGTGVQIFGTVVGVLILFVINFLPQSNHYSLLSTALVLWAFMGLFAGYTCTQLHTMFQGTAGWNIIAFLTAIKFPVAVFIIFSALNAILIQENSSAALPFLTLVNLFIFGYTISVPAVIIGTYIGFKVPAVINPVHPRKVPREMPTQTWYQKPIIWTLMGGFISYNAVLRELFSLLASIYTHQLYNSYGSLLLALIFLIITCAVSTIIICYNQLCKENYHWWWSSFFTGGSSALYFILFSMYCLLFRLQITGTVPLILSFLYVLITAAAFFLMTGSIGFLACFWFIRLIYSSVKID